MLAPLRIFSYFKINPILLCLQYGKKNNETMKMANYSNQSAGMLALLTLLLLPVSATEQQIDTTKKVDRDAVYAYAGGGDFKLLQELTGEKSPEVKITPRLQLIEEVEKRINSAIDKNNAEDIKDISKLLSDYDFGRYRGCEDWAFMTAFQKENKEMLQAVISLHSPTKGLSTHIISDCLKLAINFNKKDLLGFLSDSSNLGNIDQGYVDAIFSEILDHFHLEGTADTFSGDWNKISETNISKINNLDLAVDLDLDAFIGFTFDHHLKKRINVACDWKAVVDFIFDDFSINPSKECINKCLKRAVNRLNSINRLNKNFKKGGPAREFNLNNIHNSIKVLLYRCKEKEEKVDQGALNNILDEYVENLKNNQPGTAEYDAAVKMIAEIPFSEEVYEKSARLSAYFDANDLSDDCFVKIAKMPLELNNSMFNNVPLVNYLINRFLSEKKGISKNILEKMFPKRTKEARLGLTWPLSAVSKDARKDNTKGYNNDNSISFIENIDDAVWINTPGLAGKIRNKLYPVKDDTVQNPTTNQEESKNEHMNGDNAGQEESKEEDSGVSDDEDKFLDDID